VTASCTSARTKPFVASSSNSPLLMTKVPRTGGASIHSLSSVQMRRPDTVSCKSTVTKPPPCTSSRPCASGRGWSRRKSYCPPARWAVLNITLAGDAEACARADAGWTFVATRLRFILFAFIRRVCNGGRRSSFCSWRRSSSPDRRRSSPAGF